MDQAVPPPPDTVDVWRVPLIDDPERLQACRAVLSADEWERVDRFRVEGAKRALLWGRSVLRILLGRCAGVSPQKIAFRYLPQGKPELAPEFGPWRFNVSHSGDLAVIALARGIDVGVDVEAPRSMSNVLDLARRFFSQAEQAELTALPAAQRDLAFLLGWTRKEAFLKALGTGLTRPLDSFDVTLRPEAEPKVLAIQGRPAKNWRLTHLELGQGYRGALAVPQPHLKARGWTWAPEARLS